MKKLELHWKILIGMALGVVVGGLALWIGEEAGAEFVIDWIKPFGTIFINLLKLIAVPLVIASLIKGVSDLKDISKLSNMGGRTIVLYLCTTVVAITVGLLIVNVVGPGRGLDAGTRAKLEETERKEAERAGRIIQDATEQQEKGPLEPLVELVPENLLAAASNNANMLQVIFFVIFFGIGLILIPEAQAAPVKAFFDGLNEVILKLIDLIMRVAPYGVFALLAAMVVETPTWDVFLALLMYSTCVLVGLAIMIFAFYPLLMWSCTRKSYGFFFRGIAPAQLLAFSTSSSAATLPVTMERVEEHLGVDEEVTSFVLPIGATVNMDGTSLYQAIAAVFISQVYAMDLSLWDQLTIVLTATLASIGTAAVPSAGIVMLVIVLNAIEVPAAGIALILAVDRVLDMCRTVANITGDATVAMLVAKSVGKLGEPHVKEWDDYYHQRDDEEGDGESAGETKTVG